MVLQASETRAHFVHIPSSSVVPIKTHECSDYRAVQVMRQRCEGCKFMDTV